MVAPRADWNGRRIAGFAIGRPRSEFHSTAGTIHGRHDLSCNHTTALRFNDGMPLRSTKMLRTQIRFETLLLTHRTVYCRGSQVNMTGMSALPSRFGGAVVATVLAGMARALVVRRRPILSIGAHRTSRHAAPDEPSRQPNFNASSTPRTIAGPRSCSRPI